MRFQDAVMDVEDAVLSDALVGAEVEEVGESIGENRYKIVRTRYEFWNIPNEVDDDSSEEETDEPKVDAYGDLIVRRRPKCRDFFLIDHTMATTLEDVGLQIWHGALLLCDYVLYRHEEIRGKVVLELGCGAGLTAICAGLAGADTVLATDSDPKSLEMTSRNVEQNSSLLPNHGHTIKPRVLNWKQPLDESISKWPQEDQDATRSCSIILAADVIYDPDLNEALFSTIESVCKGGCGDQTILISLEKRYNFTLSDLDVACPAYSHFLSWIDAVKMKGWSAERIDTGDVPVCFSYQRNSDMELWRLYVSAKDQ